MENSIPPSQATPELFSNPPSGDPPAASPVSTNGKHTRPVNNDSEEEDSSKIRIVESASAEENTSPSSSDLAAKVTAPPANPVDIRLKHFMSAMENTGWERSAFMVKIPPSTFYCCRALHLQHKYGNFSKSAAKKAQASANEQEHWKSLEGTVEQDAFMELHTADNDLKAKHDIFKS